MQRPTRAQIKRKATCETPVVLKEELINPIARLQKLLLQINLERIHLAEKEAGESVSARGYALLVCAGDRKCERAGRIRRRYGVELVPPQIGARFEGVSSAHIRNAIDELPNSGLKVGRSAGRGAELLKTGEGEQRQNVVECGVCRNAWNT